MNIQITETMLALVGIAIFAVILIVWALMANKNAKIKATQKRLEDLGRKSREQPTPRKEDEKPKVEPKVQPKKETVTSSLKKVFRRIATPITRIEIFKILVDRFVLPKTNDHGEVQLTDEFKEVIEWEAKGEPLIFVTGGAGTGKTTLVQCLVEQGLVDVVVAFTGAAALNARGNTIHSFFQFPILQAYIPEHYPVFGQVSRMKEAVMRQMNVLVIDEISMVRSDLLDAIDYRLRQVRGKDGNLNPVPFGGVRVILVGDPYQLPPIVDLRERRYFQHNQNATQNEQIWLSEFFFDAHVLKRFEDIKVMNLSHIFRQENDKEYTDILNQVRRGQNIEGALEYFNRRVAPQPQNTTVITTTNQIAENINKENIKNIPEKSEFFEGGSTGTYREWINKKLRQGATTDTLNNSRKLPAPYLLELKVGAMVMTLVNDIDLLYVNGSIGIVTGIYRPEGEPPSVSVLLTTGHRVNIQAKTWEDTEVEYDDERNQFVVKVIGTYTQFPLMLAWAITTHKVQGKTLPRAHINYDGGAFADGQLYVALSRTRSSQDLTIQSPLNYDDFRINKTVSDFCKSINIA